MKYWALIGILFCGGCKQLMPVPFTGTANTSEQMNVLVAGQSNGERFWDGGYEGFRGVYPQAQFVNCAVGGTSLNQWAKGGSLYQACQDKVKGIRVDVILFIQGENEAEGGPMETDYGATHWGINFTNLVTNLRNDFNNAPVYFSRIGDFNDPSPYWDEVRAQQTRIYSGVATMVNIDGIPPIPGDRHYTPDGYKMIGARFALALKEKTL